MSHHGLLCVYLFSRQIAKGKHKAPVEVSLSSQRVVVDISFLAVIFQTFQPAAQKEREAGLRISSSERKLTEFIVN